MSTPVNRFDLDSQTALLARVRAGYTVRAASKELGFAEITVFKLRKRDPLFREALVAAQAVGKVAGKARKVARTREAMRALSAASPPAADHVGQPQGARPTESLRALVSAMTGDTTPDMIAVGQILDGQLFMSPVGFDRLFEAAMRSAKQRAVAPR